MMVVMILMMMMLMMMMMMKQQPSTPFPVGFGIVLIFFDGKKTKDPKGKFNVLQKFFINIPGRSTTESELCFLVHSIIRRLNHVSLTIIRTESISKLSNFNFQWTKTLYQNNLNNIAFFFTFFMGSRCN